MRTLVLIALLVAGFQPARQTEPVAQTTPADVPPALDYSQRDAIFMLRALRFEIEQQRAPLKAQLDNLDGRLASITETEKAIATEYSQQHPGWHLDDKFQPVRDAAAPARPAPAARQK